MNSYDATSMVKALDDIAGSMPDPSDIADAIENGLSAIDSTLDMIASAASRIADVMEQDRQDRKDREEAERNPEVAAYKRYIQGQ